MPYELRMALRLKLRVDDLDVGVIAGADVATKLIIADVKRMAAEHGLTVEVDPPKLVGIRAKGEPEAEAAGAPMLNLGAGAHAGELGKPADETEGLEIPENLRRR